jgi:hypothetical protein
VSPSVARTNFALARAVAGLAFSAASLFVTSPAAATAMWMLLVCRRALTGKGPRWVKVGGRVFYYREDLDAFIAGPEAA